MKLKALVLGMGFLVALGCVTQRGAQMSWSECKQICEAVTESYCAREVKRQRGCSAAKRDQEMSLCLKAQCGTSRLK